MSEERVIDWEGIEREYIAGIKSLREIASEFGVSHTLIGRRARDKGWERNLTAKIQAKADALVSKAAVSTNVSSGTHVNEREVIEANAQVQASIRREHRTDIQRSKRIANKLMAALEALDLPAAPDATAEQAKKESHASDMADVLKQHASILKQLVDTQRVVVAMEREAFGIAQMVEAPEEQAATNHSEGLRRLAFLLYRAGTAPTTTPPKEPSNG